MFQTNAQFMSEPARVERVINKFMNMTLQELDAISPKVKKNIDFITEVLVPSENMSPQQARGMPYIELAGLVGNVGNNPKYNFEDHDSRSEQLFYARCLACALLEAYWASSVPVKLFLSLPLKTFYLYMNNVYRANTHQKLFMTELMQSFNHLKMGCNCTPDYTIKDFLQEKLSEANKIWIPSTSLKTFEERINAVHEDMAQLLVDSFCTAYPQRCDAKSISPKYNDSKSEWSHYVYDEKTSQWIEK